ncbi:Peptidyl-prolyl cis-trans isomerase-like protein [Quillaja saponaria]|uniref:Peptidyl-prolyl cis-trans isomerase n=1 Tax=Quillaja saponaria TaxID=32244 RepID=A0AAD7QIA8_QUISA|nr:Peptidyl-prolyl cis-trans isomerase-like protein [Quillaja saponaria]
MSVLIVTSLGDIVMDLHTDKCPLTCKNFLKLCKVKYYNGCLFHTVQKDFTAQTGDPTGTGTGGDSIYKFLYGDQARFFNDEIHLDLKHSRTGTVAMASAGENLNASQFYITLRDDLDYLDGKHTVFGEVAEGLETLTRINEAYVDEKSRPYKNIRIKHTYILDDPFDDPPQLAELIPDASPEGKPKHEVEDTVRLEDDWVPMDEQLGPGELEEVLQAKEAHSRAVVLESIGDIPDAEMKPPENVLFVCKLNPVTEDEDLHTIFSRFGTVISAEIIRDFKTGDSLCYAFIEFENREACEQAYFKMDNALIDDRRIHVDFSQSVAKLWSQYRRKDQMGKGRGCFKCGAVDHMAKDCTGSPAMKQQTTKYILKDNNRQHGGDNNSRYEMVFDGDNPERPRQETKHRGHSQDGQVENLNVSRHNSKDLKHTSLRDQEKKDSNDRDRHTDRTSGHRDGRTNPETRASRYDRSPREQDHREERRNKEKHMERRRNIDDDNKINERDYRKRSMDDGHVERRPGGDYRRIMDSSIHVERRDDRDYGKEEGEKRRKRSTDYDGHDRKDDKDYRKRPEDNDRRDMRNEASHKSRSAVDDDYRDRREEREYRRRDIERDDDRDRRHQGDKNRRR